MDTNDEALVRRVGQVIDGHWTLERLIGAGGMAAVYAARAPDGEAAALKLLHPEMGLKSDVRERFLREAYAANRVEHPGAVRILGHGTTDGGVAYLVMELLEGEPLRDRVERHGQLPLPELLDYTDQVLDVLAAAHAVGIVHRDLKPDNLFVTNDGRMKVLDFGVARILYDAPSDFKTRTGTALGTLPYMAPEQALGRTAQIDGRTDLFSVGATLFRILSGRRLHEADSEAELLMAMASKSSPPLASVAPDVPAHVCAIVDLSLAFAREARYPDAKTMQEDVRAVRAGKEPPYVVGQRILATREEATIVEARGAARAKNQTVPLSAMPALGSVESAASGPSSVAVPSSAPHSTGPRGAPTDAASPGLADPQQPRSPAVLKTSPLPAVAAAAASAPPAVPVATGIAPAGFGPDQNGPHSARASGASRRSPFALLALVGVVVLLLAGATVAAVLTVSPRDDAAEAASESPAPPSPVPITPHSEADPGSPASPGEPVAAPTEQPQQEARTPDLGNDSPVESGTPRTAPSEDSVELVEEPPAEPTASATPPRPAPPASASPGTPASPGNPANSAAPPANDTAAPTQPNRPRPRPVPPGHRRDRPTPRRGNRGSSR